MATRLTIVVLGKQGAGKGTQCTYLAARYGIPHVSTGDMLRAAIKEGSDLGRQVEAVLARGELVSDDLIIALVDERLRQSDAAKGALLDGCTRTLAQAEALEVTLGANGLAMCLNIDVPAALVADRLSQRRVCQECNTIYTAADPAAVSGTCEKCGGDVIQRADDTVEAIARRLQAYEKDTAPLLDFYSQRGLLETVDGNQSVEAVSAAIDAAIQRRGLV